MKPAASTGDPDSPQRGEGEPASPRRNDDELAELARLGDPAAIEELLRNHMRRIHATCRRICRDPSDADDAAQEAMIAIVRGLPRFDGRSAVSSWIYRITTNACIDELRRRRRRPEPADPDPEVARAGGRVPDVVDDPAEAAMAAEQRAELAEALSTLREEYRIAVVLRDVADLDYAGIAEVTGVPVGTVRSRIARGRARLAEVLAAQDPAAVPAVREPNSPMERRNNTGIQPREQDLRPRTPSTGQSGEQR